jgi:hypothetical protein
MLRQDASELPPRLKYLVAQLADADRELSPSIVPSFEDMTAGRDPVAAHRDNTCVYADLAL